VGRGKGLAERGPRWINSGFSNSLNSDERLIDAKNQKNLGEKENFLVKAL